MSEYLALLLLLLWFLLLRFLFISIRLAPMNETNVMYSIDRDTATATKYVGEKERESFSFWFHALTYMCEQGCGMQ